MSESLRLWSVTSLIRLGLGTSDALVNWAVGQASETAYDKVKTLQAFVEDGDREGAVKWLRDSRFRKSGKAMARGTELHAAAEKLALGVTPEVDDEIAPYLDQYRRFLVDHEPTFLLAEAPVYAPANFYAGTLDAIVEIGGQRLVLDIKTTEHAPDSGRYRPPYPEAALQLTAYRRATDVGVLAERRMASGKRYYLFDPDQTHDALPETDGAAVLVVSPFDYVLVPVRTDDEVWRAFLAVREAARFQVDIAKRIFGPPITAAVAA